MQHRQFFLFFKCWINCVGVALNRDTSVLDDYATERCMLQWQLLIHFFFFFTFYLYFVVTITIKYIRLYFYCNHKNRLVPCPSVCVCTV